MKAIRWSIYFSSLVALSLALSPVDARADSNSVQLMNLTTGGITNYQGNGILIGQIEVGGNATNGNIYIGSQIAGTTNIAAGTAGTASGHATRVAGVMVSTSAAYPGVAPSSTVYSVQLVEPTDTLENDEWFLATQQMARVINQSLGTDPVGTNSLGTPIRFFNTLGTSVVERAEDAVVSQTGVTIVQVSGNEAKTAYRGAGAGTVGGTNTLDQEAGAYNIIVVGSVTNAVSGTATNLSGFSSRGYLVNGRSAVDIVAPGEGIIMPTFPVGPGGNAVSTNSGTSYAAPAVAGVTARLIQYGSTLLNSNAATDPRTMKAVLLNSATKLPGWGQGAVLGGTPGLNGTMTAGVNQVTQPLDPNQGAGMLNANGAYLQLAAGKQTATIQQNGLVSIINPTVALTGWDFNSVKLSLTNLYQLSSQAAGTLSITLDWYRDVGPTISGTNSILGLANLGLNLYSSANNQFTNTPLVAQSISMVDNIEHLWFTNVSAAYYEFGVGYNGYSSQGGPTPGLEDYSIAWSFTAVPEPSSLLLAGLGLTTLWWGIKRRRQA